MRNLSAADTGPVKINTRARTKITTRLLEKPASCFEGLTMNEISSVTLSLLRCCETRRRSPRGVEPFELLERFERLELFTTIKPHGIANFFRMFTASFGALRIEAAIFPASSPGTKRGGDPWLFSHSLRNAGSFPIAWNACLSSVTRPAGVLGEKAMIRVNE